MELCGDLEGWNIPRPTVYLLDSHLICVSQLAFNQWNLTGSDIYYLSVWAIKISCASASMIYPLQSMTQMSMVSWKPHEEDGVA